jgi:hypothetical protein
MFDRRRTPHRRGKDAEQVQETPEPQKNTCGLPLPKWKNLWKMTALEIFLLTKEVIDSVLQPPPELPSIMESTVAVTESRAEEWSGFESEKTEK